VSTIGTMRGEILALYFFARRLMASNNVLEVRWLGDDRRSEAFGCRERALHVLDVYSTHGSSS
jgi:hypothetical protein